MIPKIIHYVWLGDPNKKPKLLFDCIESWKKFCPDYQIMEWNENNISFSESIYAREAYEKKKYAFVADYIRIKVLNEYGGIYLDTDVEITKSFDDLLENEFLISFENEVHLETAILASTKGHPFTKQIIDFYLKYPFVYKDKPDTTPAPVLLTHFLRKNYGLKLKNRYQKLNNLQEPDQPTVTALPTEYFCPINYTTKEMKKTENTYAIHYFSATWFSGKMKTREKFLKGIYKTLGKKIFSSFTKSYVNSVSRKVEKRLKKIEKKENPILDLEKTTIN